MRRFSPAFSQLLQAALAGDSHFADIKSRAGGTYVATEGIAMVDECLTARSKGFLPTPALYRYQHCENLHEMTRPSP